MNDAALQKLAETLIAKGQSLDAARLQNLSVPPAYGSIKRSKKNPPFIELSHVTHAAWADNAVQPLDKGEAWNVGRRATASGTHYPLDAQGYPINPYGDYGLRGRGSLGQYGPNHAVDNGILMIEPDATGTPTLYVLGILRKHDNNAPALNGGFAKYTRTHYGAYVWDKAAQYTSQMEEWFEELVSGSVPLLPAYASRLQEAFAAAGSPIAEYGAFEASAKLEQVQAEDPGFLKRLYTHVASATTCYTGPVLCDPRTTNQAWIETRLSWAWMSPQIWADICGQTPRFPYAFKAGDDASGVVKFRLDETLAMRAYASHGAFCYFLAASCVLDSLKTGDKLPESVLLQIKNMTKEQNKPRHSLKREH